MTTKYSASVARRPNRSASGGSAKQPAMVPTDSTIVPYDANRAASAAAKPSRPAICVTDAGTYTDPAHNPTIDTSRYSAFSHVRRAYSGVNSLAKAVSTDGRSRLRRSHVVDSWTAYWMKVTSTAGVPPIANIQRQPYFAPTK